MAGGLRYESLADMPEGMRIRVAGRIIPTKALPSADAVSKASKYGNKKTVVNGIAFDSQKEANRYLALMDALREGVIEDLRLQQEFTLQEAYTTPDGQRFQAIRYKADFTYTVAWRGEYFPTGISFEDMRYWQSRAGQRVIEDVKTAATRTRVYINKYKMMADKGHIIREV